MRELVLRSGDLVVLAGRHQAAASRVTSITRKLMTPMFVREPAPYGFPKIFIAAVGDAMTEMCGEMADGMLGHAFTTKRYSTR